jgi:hypothetical protein
MPLDPSIPLNVLAPKVKDPMESYGQVLEMRNVLQRGRMQDELMKKHQAQTAALEEKQTRLGAVSELLSQKPDASDEEIYQRGGVHAADLIKSRAEQRKLAMETQYKDVETRKAKAIRVGEILGPVNDAASFQNAVNQMVREKLLTQEEGQQELMNEWGPALQARTKQEARTALSGKEQLDAHSKALADAIAKEEESRKAAKFPWELEATKSDAAGKAATLKGQHPDQVLRQSQLSLQKDQFSEEKNVNKETVRHHRATERISAANAAASRAAANAQTGKKAFDVENTLRDEFRAESKNYKDVRDAYGRISTALEGKGGPMSDVSLIFQYMKMLDPGSTVREGEFATVQNAGSIPQRVWAQFNKAKSGERIHPSLKEEIKGESAKLFSRAKGDHEVVQRNYGDIAKRYGANPENVLVDFSTSVPSTPPANTEPIVGGMYNGEKITKVTKIK